MRTAESSIGVTEINASESGVSDFERLYEGTAEDVVRYFLRRTGSPETAADLTAETFAAALTSWTSYELSKGSHRQWVFGIAHHQLTRYLRRRRVDSRARKELGMRRSVDLDAESRERIEQLVDLRTEFGRLDEALEELSSKAARAVELRIGQELPYEEVADRLGISETAARARVSRGLNRLAEILEASKCAESHS